MRTIEEHIFTVKELSDKSKEKAYQKWLQRYEYPWCSENLDSLKAFCEIFPVNVKDYAYGESGREYVKSEFQPIRIASHYCYYEDYEEMSGQRLATYIWNNYRKELYMGRYYSKGVQYKADGSRTLKNRRSKIMLVTDCVLTGYSVDNAILGPIYEFMRKPDNTTFPELLDKCLNAWTKSCSEDIEAATTMEAFEEDAEANNWEFYMDGRMY
jgi:hypothetical protein